MPDVKRPVLFCGENPGITLYEGGTDQVVAVVSYWYCTYSPYGTGHALVLWHEQSGNGISPGIGSGIFTDNLPLARFLVTTLTQHFPEFRGIPVVDLPFIIADCQHQSNDAQAYMVTCIAPDISLIITWGDMLDHKYLNWPQFPAGSQTYDLTTVICPCRYATIVVNGHSLTGEVRVTNLEHQPSSSVFLAFSETWVGPLPPTT